MSLVVFRKACLSIFSRVSSIHSSLLAMYIKVSPVVLTALLPTFVYVNFKYSPYVLYASPISLLLTSLVWHSPSSCCLLCDIIFLPLCSISSELRASQMRVLYHRSMCVSHRNLQVFIIMLLWWREHFCQNCSSNIGWVVVFSVSFVT